MKYKCASCGAIADREKVSYLNGSLVCAFCGHPVKWVKINVDNEQ